MPHLPGVEAPSGGRRPAQCPARRPNSGRRQAGAIQPRLAAGQISRYLLNRTRRQAVQYWKPVQRLTRWPASRIFELAFTQPPCRRPCIRGLATRRSTRQFRFRPRRGDRLDRALAGTFLASSKAKRSETFCRPCRKSQLLKVSEPAHSRPVQLVPTLFCDVSLHASRLIVRRFTGKNAKHKRLVRAARY